MSEPLSDQCFEYVELPVPSAGELGRTRDFFARALGWEYTTRAPTYADTAS